MKNVIEYIGKRTAALESNPFILWLSDERIPARDRLSGWLSCAAFFVLGFMDLNAEVLKYPDGEAAADPRKKAINNHLAENSNHWRWYLSDLQKLELDWTIKFSEALRFLWSNETKAQRLATYELCKLAGRADDPVVRYSLLAALEAYAHLLFATLLRVSETFERQTAIGLAYLGPVHFKREPGHLANQHDDTEDVLRVCELTETTRALAMDVAGKIADLIDSRWREFHRFAESAPQAETKAVSQTTAESEMMPVSKKTRMLVIGGGPAGSTAAGFLARVRVSHRRFGPRGAHVDAVSAKSALSPDL